MIKTLIVMLPILASVVSAMYIGINYVNEFEVQFENQAQQITELENKLQDQRGMFDRMGVSVTEEFSRHQHDDMRNIIENNKRSIEENVMTRMDLLRQMIDEMSRDKEEINHQISEANRISTENRARLDAIYSTVERKVSEDVFRGLQQQVETMNHKYEDAIRMWLELERRFNEEFN